MGTWSGSVTKKAPSNEGASFIGSSHSLTGVRSTTVSSASPHLRVGFSSPVIFLNSCTECTIAFIMAQEDICSFVDGFVRAERSSEYLAIPRDHYIQIGPSLLIFLSTQNLGLGQLTSK